MQLLLRKYISNLQGKVEFTDNELSADKIQLGSSPACEFQLLGQQIIARHAQLQAVGKQVQLVVSRHAVVLVNGKPVRKASLKKDDQIQIGEHLVKVMDCPPGFDLALEWHVADTSDAFLANAYKTSLHEAFVSPRILSWLLLLVVAIGGIAYPYADYFGFSGKAAVQQQSAFRAGKYLSSGPLHSAHQAIIGDNCEACHQQPFVQVRDEVCQDCHREIQDHVPSWHQKHPQFAGFACQNCHKEHNEPRYLTVNESGLCVDCHRNEKPAISGFSAQTHSDFQLSLLLPSIVDNKASFLVDWQVKRAKASPSLKENNHLKFPHDVHLDAGKVSDPQTNGQLSCSACHALDADREHFEPIEMEKHCMSCHDLGFDDREPQKALPHSDPVRVWEMLQAHFISKSFTDNQQELDKRRRIPGKKPEEVRCKNDFECANRLARDEAERQFTRSGCITCHEVKTIEGVEPRSRWQVLPVKLAQDWYSLARFDHQSHLTQPGHVGNGLCLSCHTADHSKTSNDILIPAMDNCLQCHDDSGHAESVELECVACHAYHNQGLTLGDQHNFSADKVIE